MGAVEGLRVLRAPGLSRSAILPRRVGDVTVIGRSRGSVAVAADTPASQREQASRQPGRSSGGRCAFMDFDRVTPSRRFARRWHGRV
jgi:hypothetical protein